MVLSSLAPSMSTLEKFAECTSEEIYRTIMASQSKSCELDDKCSEGIPPRYSTVYGGYV